MSGIRLTVDLDLITCGRHQAEQAIRIIQAAFEMTPTVSQPGVPTTYTRSYSINLPPHPDVLSEEETDQVPFGGKPSETRPPEEFILQDGASFTVGTSDADGATVETRAADPAEIFGAAAKVADVGYPPIPPLNGVPASQLDKAGLRWDPRIHAESRSQIKDGTWRKKRGVDDAVVVAVEAELRGRAASNWANGTENEVHFTAHGQLLPSADPPNAVGPSVAVPAPPTSVPPPPPVAAAPPLPPVAPPTTMAGLAKWAAPSLVTGKLKQSALNDAAKAAGLVDQAGNGWFTGLGQHPEYVPAVYAELSNLLATPVI